MKIPPFAALAALLFVIAALPLRAAGPDDARIPEPLRQWTPWALWGNEQLLCPPDFNNPEKRAAVWLSRLELDATNNGAKFSVEITTFRETWAALPGGADNWPSGVMFSRVGEPAENRPIPVLERDKRPAVFLSPGTWKIEGTFAWRNLPDLLPIPTDTALLSLRTNGEQVEAPAWDPSGNLWLRKDSSAEAPGKNFLSMNAYGLIGDGIPMRLDAELEITVSGEPREEDLGVVLPEGWKLSAVNSPLPAMVDDAGRLRVRVRAGRWTLRLSSFRFDNPAELRFATAPGYDTWLVAFRADPTFRTVELAGVPSVDVAQTTFPSAWRQFPVYSWSTKEPLRVEERMRGMGGIARRGLAVSRQWWLSENGKSLTFRDSISGTAQTLWRIDAATGQQPGSVSLNGEGLLLTKNPATGAPGVEIRERSLQLVAAGTMARASSLDAIGWNADADPLRVTLNLPPGWRAFAVFGPDSATGEWISSWSLLDLFLLLLLTFAVYRLFGMLPSALAFLTLGLTLPEPGAPVYLWFALLFPAGLLRVVSHPPARPWLLAWKWITALFLILALVPFLSRQIQTALFPQLEKPESGAQPLNFAAAPQSAEFAMESPAVVEETVADGGTQTPSRQRVDSYTMGWGSGSGPGKAAKPAPSKSNLLFDKSARIQTGPGVPQWEWRAIQLSWNGPVAPGQQVEMILVPPLFERLLSAMRAALAILLALAFLKPRGVFPKKSTGRSPGAIPAAAAAVLISLLAFASNARAAEFPPESMIETLRKRLMETSPAFPVAAEIPFASLSIENRGVSLLCKVHTATTTAVPLPLRLPAWSPVSVSIENQPGPPALRREGDALWIVVPKGEHTVRIEGMLPDIAEWEWSFPLRPRRVEINAPGWTVSGVRANGVPENQILFTRADKSAAGETTFERQPLESLLQVRRTLEIGLVWRVTTEVVRLTPPGRAVSARIPLLVGENIISQNIEASGGAVEARLGANQSSFRWESELSPVPSISLGTDAAAPFVERWEVIASPVWNVTFDGLAPFFEDSSPALVPVWLPWPGENVTIAISRPEAIPGPTTTVDSATRVISPGARQTTSSLDLALRASLGSEFFIALPPGAEVTALNHAGRSIPVRMDNGRVVFPLQPGAQNVRIEWREAAGLARRAVSSPVALPVDSANLTLQMNVPASRWVLWTDGPLRGPAVRLWLLLAVALITAAVLSRIPASPLRFHEWALLGIGLTQAPLPAAIFLVAWLFLLVWRASPPWLRLPALLFNFGQLFLIAATMVALAVLLFIVTEGLLGNPEMFIAGNGSSSQLLNWYAAASGPELPATSFFSVSVWWYRLLMLLWALWLASALLRWLRTGWTNFCAGGAFRSLKSPANPPPIPPQNS